MDDNLVIVCEAEDRIELLLICQLLQEAGIQCLAGSSPRVWVTRRFNDMRIQVLPQNAALAQALIADFRAKTDAGALAVGEPSALPEALPPSLGIPTWAILLTLATLAMLAILSPLLIELYQRWFRHY